MLAWGVNMFIWGWSKAVVTLGTLIGGWITMFDIVDCWEEPDPWLKLLTRFRTWEWEGVDQRSDDGDGDDNDFNDDDAGACFCNEMMVTFLPPRSSGPWL